MGTSEINIAQLITETINSLFSDFFTSIDSSLYLAMDDLVFINTDIMDNSYLVNILNNKNISIIMIADSLAIGFLLYYSISYLLSYLTFSQVEKPLQFIFKLALCTIFVNFSFFLCNQIIFFNSSISLAIRGIGETLFGSEICFSSLIDKLNSSIYLLDFNFTIFSLDGLIKSFISIGLLNLALSYALRYIMILVFIIISPFAFLSLLLNNTSWIFKSWIKIFLSLLFLQIIIPIILLIIFSLDFSNTDTFSKLICIGSIYALIRANTYLREFMGGLSTDINVNIPNIKSMFTGG